MVHSGFLSAAAPKKVADEIGLRSQNKRSIFTEKSEHNAERSRSRAWGFSSILACQQGIGHSKTNLTHQQRSDRFNFGGKPLKCKWYCRLQLTVSLKFHTVFETVIQLQPCVPWSWCLSLNSLNAPLCLSLMVSILSSSVQTTYCGKDTSKPFPNSAHPANSKILAAQTRTNIVPLQKDKCGATANATAVFAVFAVFLL